MRSTNTNLVFHKVNGVYTASFDSAAQAIRYAKKKYPNKDIGTPFRWGSGYNIFVYTRLKPAVSKFLK